MFNTVNFNWNMYTAPNSTINGTGLNLFWCPSDPVITGLNHLYSGGALDGSDFTIYYTSYGACTGEFMSFAAVHIGPSTACYYSSDLPVGGAQMNGVIYILSHVGLSGISDGTSNTFLFSERAHGNYPPSDTYCWNWWTSGNYGDTM